LVQVSLSVQVRFALAGYKHRDAASTRRPSTIRNEQRSVGKSLYPTLGQLTHSDGDIARMSKGRVFPPHAFCQCFPPRDTCPRSGPAYQAGKTSRARQLLSKACCGESLPSKKSRATRRCTVQTPMAQPRQAARTIMSALGAAPVSSIARPIGVWLPAARSQTTDLGCPIDFGSGSNAAGVKPREHVEDKPSAPRNIGAGARKVEVLKRERLLRRLTNGRCHRHNHSVPTAR